MYVEGTSYYIGVLVGAVAALAARWMADRWMAVTIREWIELRIFLKNATVVKCEKVEEDKDVGNQDHDVDV